MRRKGEILVVDLPPEYVANKNTDELSEEEEYHLEEAEVSRVRIEASTDGDSSAGFGVTGAPVDSPFLHFQSKEEE